MKIHFVTRNPNKLREAREILEGIKIERIDLDVPEIQAKEVEDVVREKARAAANLSGKTVMVEDTGFYLDAFNGFPGAMITWVIKDIGNRGILKLMEGIKNRGVTVKAAIGYCSPDSEPNVFVGVVKGEVAEKERGTGGFGFDPIFIPEGHNQTYAEMGVKNKNKISHRRRALEKFREFIGLNNE